MKIQELFEATDYSYLVKDLFQSPEFKKFSQRFEVFSTERQHKNGTVMFRTKPGIIKSPREYSIKYRPAMQFSSKFELAVKTADSSMWAKLSKNLLPAEIKTYAQCLAIIENAFQDWLNRKLTTKGKDFSGNEIHHLDELKPRLSDKPYKEFICYDNYLTTLEGLPPLTPDADLNASHNELESPLAGVPKQLGVFNVRHNKLTSFEGFPEKAERIYTEANPIKSFSDAPKYIKYCEVLTLPCVKTGLMSLFKIQGLKEILFNAGWANVSKEEKEIFDEVQVIVKKHLADKSVSACQTELMRNGFKEFART